MATFKGRWNFFEHRLQYTKTRDAGTYLNVSPLDKAAGMRDAGLVYFNQQLAMVDENIFYKYRYKGVEYCAAPVLQKTGTDLPSALASGLLSNAAFFLVGENC